MNWLRVGSICVILGYAVMQSRLQVFTAVTANSAVTWDVTVCVLVEVYRNFEVMCCLSIESRRWMC
jgi:hypothetical protein